MKTVEYDKNCTEKTGFLVTLYRYDRHNADEQTIVMRYDPGRVDGHGVAREK
jgi:hypothetical protein